MELAATRVAVVCAGAKSILDLSKTLEILETSGVPEAEATGAGRKDLTPFLVLRLFALTGGRSLAANIALIKSNTALAAEIARLLAGRRARG